MREINLNRDWTYYREGKENEVRKVHLPHDAMLEQERIPSLKNGSFTGFYPGGNYIYKKSIYGEEKFRGKKLILEFEGIYMDSTIYMNGEQIGGHVYGYSNFYVDLSDKMLIGKDNELKVYVHAGQVPNARWYPGNGIYRPVKLWIAEKEHIKLNGITIMTKSIQPAVIHINVDSFVDSSKEAAAETEILIKYQGKPIAAVKGEDVDIEIPAPHLWSADSPHMYEAQIRLIRENQILDEYTEEFGIRTLQWSAEKGLLVNHQSVKLKGGCVHQNNGFLGSCEFEATSYRKVRIMKEVGFNAIRSSHYPMSKQMLRACDHLGMYVMDEAFDSWEENPGLYGYVLDFAEEWERDTVAMVHKDKNHPCVIMYSIGNEITETAKPEGAVWTQKLAAVCREADPTRPVTVCPNVLSNVMVQKGIGGISIADGTKLSKEDVTDPYEKDKDSKMGGSVMINILVAAAPMLMKHMLKPKSADKAIRDCFREVDIAGYNYGVGVYEAHHDMHPERIIVGSETMPPALAESWEIVKRNPYVIGDFMWTAWDYLGEAGAGVFEYGKKHSSFTKPYPTISAFTGVINLTGYVDSLGHYASVIWDHSTVPYITVRPVNHTRENVALSSYRNTDAIHSWSFRGYEGVKTDVTVYSSGAQVELLLNGKSLGRKTPVERKVNFKVKYENGTIEAVSYGTNGKEIGRDRLATAGEETRLSVMVEQTQLKATGEDLAYINVSLTDRQGIVKVLEKKKITIHVQGAGELVGIGSDDPQTNEDYKGDSFTTYQGRMQAIVRSGTEAGKITVAVQADGFERQYREINVIEEGDRR